MCSDLGQMMKLEPTALPVCAVRAKEKVSGATPRVFPKKGTEEVWQCPSPNGGHCVVGQVMMEARFCLQSCLSFGVFRCQSNGEGVGAERNGGLPRKLAKYPFQGGRSNVVLRDPTRRGPSWLVGNLRPAK